MKNKLKRLSLVLLLPVVAASSLWLVVAPQPAYAAPVDGDTLDVQLQSWLYYNALSVCIADSNLKDGVGIDQQDDEITPGHAASGEWFAQGGDATIIPIGSYISPSGPPEPGKLSCGDPSWINDALDIWGYTSNIEALCDFGFDRRGKSATDCVQPSEDNFDTIGNNGDSQVPLFQAAVNDKYYGGRAPVLTDAMEYLLYSTTFLTSCDAQRIGPLAGATTDQQNTAQGDTGYVLKVLNSESPPKMEDVIYSGLSKSDGAKISTSITPSGNANALTCKELVDLANANAAAYEQYAALNPDDIVNFDEIGGTGSTVIGCQAGSLGWLICPIFDIVTSVTETVANILDSLLQIPPLTNDTSSGVYRLWAAIRDIANIAFILVFLVVIYSQATSVGLTSYGIRKMLPRLITAAILVNLSYFICAIAIDISNIVGGSTSNFILSLPTEGDEGLRPDLSLGEQLAENIGYFSVATLVAVGGFFVIALFFLIPVLLSIIVTLFVLGFRQAIIILLLAISPLAFVAWVLPNTEKYFKKWSGLFVMMLALYPMIMALFAGSIVASGAVITNTSAPGTDQGFLEFIQQIVALIILIMPLFALPFLFKLAGGILARLDTLTRGNMSKYAGKGLSDKVNARTKRYAKVGGITAGQWAGRKAGLKMDGNGRVGKEWRRVRSADKAVEMADAARKQGKQAEISEQAAKMMGNDESRFKQTLAGSAGVPGYGGTRFGEIAASQTEQAFGDRVKGLGASYQQRPMDYDAFANELRAAMKEGRREEATALIGHLSKSGGAPGRATLEEVLTSTKASDQSMEIAVGNAIYRDNYDTLVAKRGDVAKGGFEGGVWNTSMKVQKLGSAQLATSDPATITKNYQYITQEEAQRIISEPNLRANVSNADSLSILKRRAADPTPVPSPPPTDTSGGPPPSSPPPSSGGSRSGFTPGPGGAV